MVVRLCYRPHWFTLCSSLEGIEALSESSSDELTNVSLSPPDKKTSETHTTRQKIRSKLVMPYLSFFCFVYY